MSSLLFENLQMMHETKESKKVVTEGILDIPEKIKAWVEKHREDKQVKQILSSIESKGGDVSAFFEELVPSQGPAETKAGELIRATMRLLYRDYNDGDKYYEGYGVETCGSAVAFLISKGFKSLVTFAEEQQNTYDEMPDEKYTEFLNELANEVIAHIENNPSLLIEKNDEDCLKADTSIMDELEKKYQFDFCLTDDIIRHIDNGDISESDAEYEISTWEYCDNIEKQYSYSYVINDLTKDGFDELNRSFFRWLDTYSNDLNNEYPEEDEDWDEYDESLKIKKEFRDLSLNEFNKLKKALNRRNPLKKIMRIWPVIPTRQDYETICKIDVYAKFLEDGSSNNVHWGSGIHAYNITINLIDETISIDDYYDMSDRSIDRYLNNLRNIESFEGVDIDTLKNSFKTAIENSKTDVTKVLKEKNFIYNLTGKVKRSDKDAYTLDLDESKKLTEDFDSSMPNWLMKGIKLKNTRYSRHDDLNYNYALDTLKWNNETNPKSGKLDQYANEGYIVAALIDTSGDKHLGNYIVYCPKLYINNNATITIKDRDRKICNMSMKALEPYIKELAIADANTTIIDKKRDQRRKDQSGSIDRYRVDPTSPYNAPSLDKSGYVEDPYKYKNLLAEKHLSNYYERLSDLYVYITEVKEKIKEFIAGDNFLADPNKSEYTNASKFNKIIKNYDDAVYDYKYCMQTLNKMSSGEKTAAFSSDPLYIKFNERVASAEKECAAVIELMK